ncbi:hypothetical protein GW17_00016535, partial [Ensete ventricosum]
REREAYEVGVKDGKFIYKLSSVLLHTSKVPKDSMWIFGLSTSKNLYVGQHSSFLAGGATSVAGRLVAEMRFLRIQEKSTGRCGREIVRRRWRSVRSGVREGVAQQGASPPLRLSTPPLGCKPRIAVVICLIGRSCGEHRELSQPRQGTGEQRTVRDGSPHSIAGTQLAKRNLAVSGMDTSIGRDRGRFFSRARRRSVSPREETDRGDHKILLSKSDDKFIGRDQNLHFVESPALAPPEVQIDLAAQQQ